MFSNPQAARLNSAIRNADGPVGLMRLLTEDYLRLDEDGRANLAIALIGELAARIAWERHKKRNP